MRQLIATLLILCLASPSWAATYYVAKTGNDTTGDGSSGNPWLTIQKSMTTMVAGDTTYVRAGTYTEVGIAPANSGTAASRITLSAYPGETVIVDSGYTVSPGARQPIFEYNGKDYHTLNGFYIRRGGSENIRIANTLTTTGIKITNNIIHDFWYFDNSAGIYLNNNSSDIVIARNTFYHSDEFCPETGSPLARCLCKSASTINCAAVIMFSVRNVRIQYNEVRNLAGYGVYFKHNSHAYTAGYRTIVEHNYIHDLLNDSSSAIKWGAGSNGIIRHNLMVNPGTNAACVRFWEDSAVEASLQTQYNTMDHNTCIAGRTGIQIDKKHTYTGATNTSITNNIVREYTATEYRGLGIYRYYPARRRANSTAYTVDGLPTVPDTSQSNGHRYLPTTGGTSAGTLPTWNTTPGSTTTDGTVVWTEQGDQDTSSTELRSNIISSSLVATNQAQVGDLAYAIGSLPSTVTASGNITTAPTFVNTAVADYRLAVGSAGKGVATDGGDLGACMVGRAPARCIAQAATVASGVAATAMTEALRVPMTDW